MVQITAKQVKELRDATNVGMMECKRALQETEGSLDAAIKLLRERGIAIAGKKAARTAKEGIIAASVFNDGAKAVMIEVNCETDFVTRNDTFKDFVQSLLEQAKSAEDNALAEDAKEEVVAKIAEIGENLIMRRNVTYTLEGIGSLTHYVHLGGKVGVLLELKCEKEDTVKAAEFIELAKDITLQITAANPTYLSEEDVPESVLNEEKEIYAKQMEQEGKPANIIEKIVVGKVRKFFSQICLLDQAFVKDNDQTIKQLLAAKSKDLGDTITISRFVRYQLGV